MLGREEGFADGFQLQLQLPASGSAALLHFLRLRVGNLDSSHED